jgi:hypothetical protein
VFAGVAVVMVIVVFFFPQLLGLPRIF